MSDSNQTIVLTGASAGVGRATAREFARRGARIALIARNEDALRAAAEEVRREGGTPLVVTADVADPRQVEAAAERVERELGPIDVWVNDAMASVFARVWDIDPDEFARVTHVTYLGTVYGTMAALRRMRPRGHGAIVQVGSALAYRGIPLQSAYCGSKHGIKGFTESLRTELLHDKSRVHITMVQMPALNTPQFDWARNKTGKRAQPVPPIFQPELGAEAIVFAAHAKRREIYVGWPSARAILANKIAPGLLDRYLAGAGYSGQLTNEKLTPDAPDNLDRPLPGDRGAHGRFDERASRWSAQFWLTKHRMTLLAGAGVAAAAAMIWLAPDGDRHARKMLPQ